MGHLFLEVKFKKVGNKVKYTLPVSMYCEREKREIRNSMTLTSDDSLIKQWLGKDIDKVFKKSSVVFKKVDISLAYHTCDKPMVRK